MEATQTTKKATATTTTTDRAKKAKADKAKAKEEKEAKAKEAKEAKAKAKEEKEAKAKEEKEAKAKEEKEAKEAAKKVKRTDGIPFSTVPVPIDGTILRRPEVLRAQLTAAREAGLLELVEAVDVLLPSKAANDYLEMLAVKSVGARPSGRKLGADGFFPSGAGVEAKPHKGESTSSSGGCINDDTPMKLVRDFHEIQTLVVLNASLEGDRVNWAVTAPYHYWTEARFYKICARLGVPRAWPSTREEQIAALDELETHHKKDTYVRSNPLNLSRVDTIPTSEMSLWVHPDLPDSELPKSLKALRTRMSPPPTA